jgi:hypothetical protein
MPESEWLKGPNDWLLGGNLLRQAWRIAKNTFLANEQDLRDWMAPVPDIADLANKVSAPGGDNAEYKARLDDQEMWIDYVADTGDDVETMQLLSSWFLADLWTDGTTVSREPSPGRPIALPAGAVLFLGGDTAYHVADEDTLRKRFSDPMKVGYAAAGKPLRPRSLFAIPGNHDYYDHLVGFNRLIRHAIPGTDNVLELFSVMARTQGASYTKLLLPFDWQLWAVDLGPHGLDGRQEAYFRPKHLGDLPVPARLILCTPSPAVVHRQVATTPPADEAYRRLVASTPHEWMASPTRDTVTHERALLHLSGDIHHYARYTGELDKAGVKTGVTCVVSGGGGAMLHPPVSDIGALPAVTTYPTPARAWREIGRELLLSRRTWWSGRLAWALVGLLLALGYGTRPPAAEDLVAPLILLGLTVGTVVSTVGLAFWMSAMKKKIKAEGRKLVGWPDDGRGRPADVVWRLKLYRRVILVFLVLSVIAMLTHPFFAHLKWEAINPVSTATVCVFTFGILVALLVGVMGFVAGMDHRTVGGKARFFPLAVIHTAVEVGAPLLAVLSGSWTAYAVYIGASVVVSGIARWYLGRGVERPSVPLVVLLWLAPAIVLAVLLRWDALALWAPPTLELAAAIFGMAVVGSALQFPLYLMVALALGGHNNEVGGTTRITKFKQWIRLTVTPDGVTAYVIGIDAMTERDTDGEPPSPRIVDTFRVTTGPR